MALRVACVSAPIPQQGRVDVGCVVPGGTTYRPGSSQTVGSGLGSSDAVASEATSFVGPCGTIGAAGYNRQPPPRTLTSISIRDFGSPSLTITSPLHESGSPLTLVKPWVSMSLDNSRLPETWT
jgi:hypothetical protein